jgi:large subunit ribosomal protein L29
MADSRTNALRELGDEELVTNLREAKEELFNLRFQVATGQLDNNRRLQTVRRDIAVACRPCGATSLASTP